MRLPGTSGLRASLVNELVGYSGISLVEIEELNAARLENAADAWNKIPRDSEKRIEEFYNEYFDYIIEEISVDGPYRRAPSCFDILGWLEGREGINLLDYGSGVGNAALFFHASGFKMTLADISAPMLNFCRWRFERRNWPAAFINLNKTGLPADAFDAIICLDVFEHLYDPWKHLKKLSEALKPGGLLFMECVFGTDSDRPMHVIKDSRSLDLAPLIGLNSLNCSPFRLRQQAELLVFRADRPSGLLNIPAVLMGGLRYTIKYLKNGPGRLV